MKNIIMSTVSIAILLVMAGCSGGGGGGGGGTTASISYIDSVSGLEWQDNSDVVTVSLNLSSAKTFCSSLVLNEHDDWVLPSLASLKKIYKDDGKYIDGIATKNYTDFWTSDVEKVGTFPFFSRYPISYDGINSRINNEDGLNVYHVRCVRTIN